ncbi:amino acid adenylation domain-containing protein [Dictyobacter halimunensis]|uniref:non-ribosomal peptide synthetase n=1 Tax=Dictyobacter halimunensis TaxID=3026934 RepID=UPI0030C6AD92
MQKTIEGYRLSPQQHYLWGAQQGNRFYAQAVVELTGNLVSERLKLACEQVLLRHEIFRTTFVVLSGTSMPLQVVQEQALYDWKMTDLRDLAVAEREVVLEELVQQEREHVFDLEHGPLALLHYVSLEAHNALLIMTLPALNADQATLQQFVKEVAQAYDAPASIPNDDEELVQYLQVSEWQNELLQDEEGEAGRAYWQKQRASAFADLSLPGERKALAARGSSSIPQIYQQAVSPALYAQVQHFSAIQQSTVEQSLLTAWIVLLWRLSGKSEVQLGLAMNGRIYDELTEVAGPVTQFVPFASRLYDRQSFLDALAATQATRNEVDEMQQYFEYEPGNVAVPFSFVSVVLPTASQLADGSIAMRTSSIHSAPTKIKLSVIEHDKKLALQWQYDAISFSQETIERLAAQYLTLLERAVQAPQTLIGVLPILSEAEREQLLETWNATASEYPAQTGVARLFELQAECTPDAIAVRDAEQQLTYASVNARANQLARFLRARGVGAETLVGICLPRNCEMVVSILAILKAGGAYLPLDPTYPQERLHFIIEDAQAVLLLTTGDLSALLPQVTPMILLEEHGEVISSSASTNLALETQPGNLAYVIYTSGSTGKPKGAMITLQGLTNYLCWARQFYAVESGSGAPVHSSLAFDLTVTSLFLPLLSGRGVTLVPEAQNIEALAAVMKQGHNYSLIKITPAHLEMLNQVLRPEEFAASTRALVIGGEALLAEQLLPWRDFAPQTRLINEYGPTETVVGCCIYDAPLSADLPSAVPIGTPIANTWLYVLDECLQPLPAGMPGELYIGGDGVARGYLNRPGLTAERFIPDAFSGRSGARLYKTGDVVRYRGDGVLEYIGRIDHQVKIRGFRIELGEIEVLLSQFPAVRENVVVVREDRAGDKQLVAYVVARATEPLALPALKAFLQQQLPAYMVPVHIVVLDALPLTSNGKINRHALPEPGSVEGQEQGSYAAPRTPIEQLIADIWGKVLHRQRVPLYDNFFEIGGHSLLATQLVARMRAALHIEMNLNVLFDKPVIAQLAHYVEGALRQAHGTALQPLVPVAATERVQLSFAQQRLWFLQQLEPESTAYTIPLVLRLKGTLNVSALEQSLREIVRRHEVLRTVFVDQSGQPLPQVQDLSAFQVRHVDLASTEAEEVEACLLRFLQAEMLIPFDIEHELLIRSAIIRCAAEEYVLFVNVHHLAWDGWSTSVFLGELNALYTAYHKGLASPLAELAVQYGDFAVWQRNWLQGEVLERQLAYWQQQLASAPALDLPTDFTRPAVQSYRGARKKLVIPAELGRDLELLSQREGVTLFMTLLAAFQVLLSRYAGQTDISVGTPIANRTSTEVEALLGFFVNTLVLRSDLSGNPAFTQLLQRVRQVALDAYSHQDLPFEKLVEVLQPERDPSRSPLFQVLFSLQNVDQGEQEQLLDLAVDTVQLAHETTKFDLSLIASQDDSALVCWFEYNTDLFKDQTIERLQQHWLTLLASIVASPSSALADLSLLPEQEQQMLLDTWSGVATDYPRDVSIAQLFHEQVRTRPHAIAVKWQDVELTYAELNAHANQVAHALRAHGVRDEDLVGVYTERTPALIVGMLGILKAGAAYLPLDPTYPQERLALLIDDARTKLVLSSSDLAGRLDFSARLETAPTVLTLRECLVPDYSSENPGIAVAAHQLAYVVYTSGSTGKPKGVAVPQRGVVRLVKNTTYLPFSVQETFLQLSATSFDASTLEIWGSLLNGARLVLPPVAKPSLAELAQIVRSERVSVLWLTAGLFHQMVDEHVEELAQVKYILAGGDVLSVPHVQRLLRHAPDSVVINGYGPTENTTFTTCYPMQQGDEPGDTVPIGYPIANTRIYVLDEHLRPAPTGVIGELYTGGDGLARGYLHHPELTAERFIPDPFAQEAGGRLYRTGDLVRYREDGRLEFVGRRDFQVKIRGFRIEPGEVEAVLAQHPAVGDHIVVTQTRERDKVLVAYVVPRQDASVTSAELKAFLRETLPEYMLPSHIIFLERLPLTANGKVDRRALPAIETEQASAITTEAAPRNPLQELLLEIWQQILGRQQIGIHDNFFEVGGHSLLATRLASRIRKLLNIDIALRVLFEAPTIALLSQHLQEQDQLQAAAPVIEATPHDLAPLSFAQQRLWFLEQLEPGNIAYNIPLALHLRGALNVSALQRTIHEVVRRHESLRTRFVIIDGEAHQQIDPCTSFVFSLEPVEQDQSVQDLIEQEAQQPFDLEQGPLFRARLLQISAQEAIFLLTLHHSIADGWSLNILISEISQLYTAYVNGKPSPLATLPLQYADYALWQRQWLQGEVLDAQLAYWKEQLAGAEPLALLTDHPRPAVQTHRGACLRYELSSELSQRLKQLGQSEGTTLFMTLLAAWQVLLSRYSGQEDISVGTPIANRTQEQVEGLIGFFVNTLVLRSDLSGNPDFREVLHRVREVALQAYAHQDVPFEKLVEALQPERDRSRSPLFQALFGVQHVAPNTLTLPGLEVELPGSEATTAKFELSLTVVDTTQNLLCEFEYNSDLFEAETIERLAGHWQRLLSALVSQPETPIQEISFLCAQEQQQLLVDWNEPRQTFSVSETLVQSFERQVKAHPKAIAVADERDALSYAQLNARANQLAHALRRQGVGPNQLVGLCVDRSVHTLVGLLGILKAGGAYLPLDPSYPADRLRFMLEDARVARIVSEQAQSQLFADQPELQLFLLDEPEASITQEPMHNPEPVNGPRDLAYVIYTSGSTGQPKGVCISHANVQRLFAATQHWFRFNERDVWTLFHSYAFDFSVWEIWGALLHGGKLVVVSYETSRTPEAFYLLLLREQVTVLNQTPSAFEQLQQVDASYEPEINSALALRYVIFGGEALELERLRLWLQRHGDEQPQLINMYGITETTVHVTYRRIRWEDVEQGRGSLIGCAMPDLQLYVLGERLQPVPVGVAGQLYVGGAGLASGYLHREALTAQRFIQSPFGGPGERLYQTGDLVRYRGAGELEYLGRIDQQVKIRGFRIELGEIESQLRKLPGIRGCTVQVAADGRGGKRLVGYLVQEEESNWETGALRRQLQTVLPDYMLPSLFISLSELPLTANGKLDRRALPTPEQAASQGARELVAPRDAVEEIVADLWKEILGLEMISIYDNFFEIGGHSLLATQLLSHLRQMLQIDVPLRDLFEKPVLADFAAHLQSFDVDEDDAEATAMLAEIEQLSEQEVAQYFLEKNA